MVAKVIPLADHRSLSSLAAPYPDAPASGPLADTLGRPLHDLRISVTDRCNFRCGYCMPKEIFDKHYRFLPHDALLSFEEIARVAGVFTGLGVRKIRLTGGEPLLRKNLERLVEMLAGQRAIDGRPLDLTLTTNASLLKRKAQALKGAGLQRITVSLDALDDTVFRRMNDADFPVADVLAGIDEALRVGLGPVKVNMVVKRGTNDHEIVPMARHFRGLPVTLRFIEYMDVGATTGWRKDEVLPSDDVIARLGAEFPLEPLPAHQPGETAARWRYRDGQGEVGVISSVTKAFCHDCNRARLTTEGKLFTCLFGTQGHDLRALLRGGASDTQMAGAIDHLWRQRTDRYSELRAALPPAPADGARRVEMHYIGG